MAVKNSPTDNEPRTFAKRNSISSSLSNSSISVVLLVSASFSGFFGLVFLITTLWRLWRRRHTMPDEIALTDCCKATKHLPERAPLLPQVLFKTDVGGKECGSQGPTADLGIRACVRPASGVVDASPRSLNASPSGTHSCSRGARLPRQAR